MIAKLIAHGADRDEALDRLAGGARRDGRRGRDDEPPVPPLARRASGLPGGERLDRLPDALSAALLPAAAPAPSGPWDDGWRLNLPAAPRRSAPLSRTQPAGAGRRARGGDGRVTAPMPGKVIEVRVDDRRAGRVAPAARRARGDEDGAGRDRARTMAASASVDVRVGDQVTTGALLVSWRPA